MGEEQQNLNLTYNFLVLDTIRRMRDADAAGNFQQYVVYSEYAIQLLIPYLLTETKRKIEDDWIQVQTEIANIKANDNNEQSRNRRILELRRAFADTHKAVSMATLSRVGIVKVSEEGLVNFDKTDISKIAAIIRSGGLPSGIEKVMNPTEEAKV